MHHRHSERRLALCGAAAAALLTSAGLASAADVTYQRILNPEPENWLTHHRTYDSNRYSPLDEINTENVANLRMQFIMPLAPPEMGGFAMSSLHATPLVDNGMMYMIDGWGRVYGIDLTAGDRAYIRWIMNPETARDTDGIVNNRGVALLGNTVYSVTLDGNLLATNAETGELMWAVPTEQNPIEYFTMAPLALDGKVIIGPAGGDAPMRGRLESRNAADGALQWTFYTIPGPGQPGYETWKTPGSAEIGGGATWATGSYDSDQNLLIWGIGNPQPDFDPTLRAGDNLYTDSTVAVNADTGELAWYFQYTPNDSWDYDEVGSQLLIRGERPILGHYARNGFFYALDATNGQFLNGVQYLDQVTWTAGLDPKTGKPVEYDPELDVQVYRGAGMEDQTVPGFGGGEMKIPGRSLNFCPYIEGGVNFYPTSYSQKTGLAYAAAIEGCMDLSEGFSRFGQVGGVTAGTPITGSISAVNPATGELVRKYGMPYVARSGVLTTAGGVVFSASVNGDFFALDDTTMEPLWNFNVGVSIEGAPVTFAVNGKQFVAVAVGPGGIGQTLHHYAQHGEDPNAAAFANAQFTSLMIFFAL